MQLQSLGGLAALVVMLSPDAAHAQGHGFSRRMVNLLGTRPRSETKLRRSTRRLDQVALDGRHAGQAQEFELFLGLDALGCRSDAKVLSKGENG